MKNLTDRLIYYFFRGSVALFTLFPFRVLYIISDGLYFLLYRVAGYRKNVVLNNLRNSFPEKSEEEILEICRKFYHHLADVFLESMKTFTTKAGSFGDHFKIINPELTDKYYELGKSVIIVAGHYNNWEWPGISSEVQLKHRPIGFYKPMTNLYVDTFVKKNRGHGRTALVSINDTVSVFKTDWGEPAAFYMIADQSPSNARLAYWMNFLNQNTAVLHGPEKYARVYDLPVVYGDIRKIRRGYYEAELILLCEHSSETKTGEITEIFMRTLEQKIRENPQYYLWSHRRWKLKKENRK